VKQPDPTSSDPSSGVQDSTGSDRAQGLLALLAGNFVTIAGVLLLGWDLLSVLFLMLLEVCASGLGLYRAVVLHQRATGDPAHQQDQFTGALRISFERKLDFADGLLHRTLPYPGVFLLMVTLFLIKQASGPLVAAVPLAIAAVVVAVLAYGETSSLRRKVRTVPFSELRARAVSMVFRTAGVTVFFMAGAAWLLAMEPPLQQVIVVYLLLKMAVEVWIQHYRGAPSA
jgi:hypothetical protein